MLVGFTHSAIHFEQTQKFYSWNEILWHFNMIKGGQKNKRMVCNGCNSRAQVSRIPLCCVRVRVIQKSWIISDESGCQVFMMFCWGIFQNWNHFSELKIGNRRTKYQHVLNWKERLYDTFFFQGPKDCKSQISPKQARLFCDGLEQKFGKENKISTCPKID